ncbi:MAG: SDR family NAD(P)-dependent oxidoreductase [Thermogemmata sp.]|nr:SDR family NAD(P)-dependent oxidoreductase [Thermogemmata sp.]
MPEEGTPQTSQPLAVVGIGCLFPGRSQGAGWYWATIKRGIDCVREVPAERWSVADLSEYYAADPKAPDRTYARRGAFLEAVEFDPLAFGIAPRDLEATDSTQLLALVAAQQALADAGITILDERSQVRKGEASKAAIAAESRNRRVARERVAVILGVTGPQELVIPLGARLAHPHWRRGMRAAGIPEEHIERAVQRISEQFVSWQENSFPGLLGNVVAGRIANRLNLGGTNCVVDAACASALAAVEMAALELETGRADVVLTGGCDTFSDIFMYMCFSKTPALSRTGDARPFDADGDGTILGEGLGLLVLKRLSDAEAAGDRIYAVIRGIGSSSDGRGAAIYAPSAEGQQRCLRQAYERAGISPATVELVEAHGTGTKVGDATEAQALISVYEAAAEQHQRRPWCALGSVKSQIGHTKAAAGAASLIKAVLALYHKVLPPTLKVRQPVEPLRRTDCPFYLNTVIRPWLPCSTHPRRAAVSAFGFGGSNFHAVLEEYDSRKVAPDWDGQVEIVPLAANSLDKLQEMLQRLPQHDDALFTVAEQLRQQWQPTAPWRLVLVVHRGQASRSEWFNQILQQLPYAAQQRRLSLTEGAYLGNGPIPGPLAVLFPGQGSQYVAMLRELVCLFPEMLESLSEADAVCGAEDGIRLVDRLYPPPAFTAEDQQAQVAALRATEWAQPALGAVCWGLWRVLHERFGLSADAWAGHSYGELVALAAAGCYSADSLWHLSHQRGRLLATAAQRTPGGMLAVRSRRDTLLNWLSQQRLSVVLANHNAPEQQVLSGPSTEINLAAHLLSQQGIGCVQLPVAGAFHSPLMAPAVAPFQAELAKCIVTPPRGPVYANINATPYPREPAAIRSLLAEQLVRPVAFVEMIQNMLRDGLRCFIEVGPGTVLTRLVTAITSASGIPNVYAMALDSSSGKGAGVRDLAIALAQLAALGYSVDLSAWERESRCRPVQRQIPSGRWTVPISGANYVAPKPTPSNNQPPACSVSPATHVSSSGSAAAGAPAFPSVSPPPSQAVASMSSVSDVRSVPLSSKESNQHTPIRQHAAEPAAPLSVNPQCNIDQIPERSRIKTCDTAVSFQPGTPQPAWAYQSKDNVSGDSPVPAVAQAATRVSSLTETDLLAPGTTMMERALHPGSNAERQTNPSASSDGKSQTTANRDMPVNPAPSAVMSAPEHGTPVVNALPSLPNVGPTCTSGIVPSWQQLLHLTHQSLATVQRIQEQTAALHKQFLETQETTQRTLLALIEQQRQLWMNALHQQIPLLSTSVTTAAAAAALQPTAATPSTPPLSHATTGQTVAEVPTTDVPVPSLASTAPSTAQDSADFAHRDRPPIVAAHSTASSGPAATDILAEQQQEPTPREYAKKIEKAPSNQPDNATTPLSVSSNDSSDEVAATVLEVVAEKTGYPVESLGWDLTLDADLGIDSIKRVEIFSALQQRLPDAPAVTAEHVGNLHTLRDVLLFLSSSGKDPSPQGMPAPGNNVFFPASSPVNPPMPLPSEAVNVVPDAGVSAGTGNNGVHPERQTDAGLESLHPKTTSVPLQSPTGMPKQTSEELRSEDGRYAQSIPSRQSSQQQAESTERGSSNADALAESLRDGATATWADILSRQVLRAVPWSRQKRTALEYPAGSKVWLVTDKQDSFADLLAEALQARGLTVQRWDWDESSRASTTPPYPVGLILVAPLHERNVNGAALSWLQRVYPGFQQVHQAGLRPFLVGITRLDGAFGLGPLRPDIPVEQGGLAGWIKTARCEWPFTACKVIDVAPEWSEAPELAAELAIEILTDGPVEIGMLEPWQRIIPQLQETPLEPIAAEKPLGPDDLVLLSGGARGVTAAVAVALAERGCRGLILVGRTPLPSEAEPAWLPADDDETAWKQAIAQQLGPGASPRQIQEKFQILWAQREIRRTLQRLSTTGVPWAYYAVDVTDSTAVRQLATTIRQSWGAVTRLIHGAGVLADKKLQDLTTEQFDRVYQTKVVGLYNLLTAFHDHPLRTIAVFSSTTARLGRAGQGAYACANEVLNKWAQREARRRPRTRVIAFNWGPWDGGMVTSALKRMFAAEGVGLILRPCGGAYACWEIERRDTAVEIIVGARSTTTTVAGPDASLHGATISVRLSADPGSKVEQPGAGGLTVTRENRQLNCNATERDRPGSRHSLPPPTLGMSLAFERCLDLASHPILADHVLDGRAVVPLALHLEWLAHAALHRHPGLLFCGCDELRIFQGVLLGAEDSIRLQAWSGPARRQDGCYWTPVELRSQGPDGRERLHSRAWVVVCERSESAPPTEPLPHARQSWPWSLQETYQRLLFHGPGWQGLQQIEVLGTNLWQARVRAAPPPVQWLAAPLRSHWLADPLVIDGALQLLIVAVQQQFQQLSLPMAVGRYRQYRPRYPSTETIVVLRVRSQEKAVVHADIEFHDEQGLIAQLQDAEVVLQTGLTRAFRRNRLSLSSLSSASS